MKPRIIRIAAYVILSVTIIVLSDAFTPHSTAKAIGNSVNAAAVPGNDNVANATDIASLLPISTEFSTTEATVQTGIDPVPQDGGCNIPAVAATVWYKYAPASPTAINIDTTDSGYDTFIAVWLGPAVSADINSANDFTFVACNDDLGDLLTSKLTIKLDAVAINTAYYIQIGDYENIGTNGLEYKK